MKTILRLLLLSLFLPVLSARGQGQVFQRITTADGLGNNQVQHIGQLADGRMLFVSWRGVGIYDGARVLNYPRQDERTLALPHHRFGYTVAACDGLVWVKEYGRLWCLDVARGEMLDDLPARLGSEGPELLDVYFVQGAPLLLTAEGLAAGKKALPLPCPADEIMSIETVGDTLLLFTTDGSVWTMREGEPRKVACPGVPPLRHVHEVRTAKGPDGKFYRKLYGDRYSRIDRFDPRSLAWQAVMEQPMVLYGMSWVDGQLTVGCRHGYFRDGMLQPSFLTESGDVLADISVQQIFTDRSGDLWVALADYGVLYTHPLRHRFASAKEPQTLAIPDSVVWDCHLRLSTLFHFTEQRDNDNLTDRQGRQWRATHNGIWVDSLHITTAHGLPSDFVQSLVEDKRGRIWVGTNRGICCVENVEPLQIVSYGVHDGVPQWDALASSAAVLEDGRLAMQFEQGWVAFHPDSVQRPAVSLTPILTTVPAETLRYFENNVTLTFTTDYYAFPQSIRYLWRVNGGEWQRGGVDNVADGQLHLNFVQLHHGKYSIEVKAATDGSAFDGETCTFRFTILPPWWQTWWAYTLYIISTLAIAAFFTRQHYRRKQERLKQQMREEALLKQIETLIKAAPSPTLPEEREYIQSALSSSSSDYTLPSGRDGEGAVGADSEFVQRAITLVHQHLADDYSVEQLAADLCMERTGLYKRLTALVNQSPQIFIRSIRLNRAVEMMKQGESITDAAYASGFNSVSYFGRCFAKEFGCSPSEYLKKL